MGKLHWTGWLLAGCAAALVPGAARAQDALPPFEPALEDESYEHWRDAILPSEAELACETIAWLPSFGEGVAAAARKGRPLLLWVMNGHPLGCT